MSFRLITDSATELYDVPTAKEHLRVDISDDDALIGSLIKAARRFCENYTGRAFITQTWELALDSVPAIPGGQQAWWDGVREGPIALTVPAAREIKMPRPPFQGPTGFVFNWYDLDDNQNVLDNSILIFDKTSSPGRVALKWGQVWPSPLRLTNAIVVQYQAGYGDDATGVPADLIHATKLMLAHLYENRETVANLGIIEAPLTVKTLLDPYRVIRL